MKLYFTLNRSFLFALFVLSITVILIFGQFSSVAVADDNGKTNGNRIDFIKGLGYTPVEEAVEVKNITIPYEFSDVYEEYNCLQLEAGFDLKGFCGLEVIRYTYTLTDGKKGDLRANLLVFNNEIIGGDISSVAIDGEMLPLIKK